MQKLLILLASILVTIITNAQTAVVKDPDGYCNIRQGATIGSKILDTLSKGRIVFVFEEEAKGDWLPVDYKKGVEERSGYIHKSRITLLTSLPKYKRVTLNDSILKLQLDTLQLTITKGKFSAKGRQTEYETPPGEQKYVRYIDGRTPWGTDGNLPGKEYKGIQFMSGSRKLRFPATMYRDLFEPNLHMTNAYVDSSTNKTYVEAFNSDGAGGYVVIWTIKDGRVVERETFIPF